MKKFRKLFGITALVAVIALSMATCGGNAEEKWEDIVSTTIPDVQWRGHKIELGDYSSGWKVNTVTTNREESGAFVYELKDNKNEVFDILHIKSMAEAPKGRGEKPITDANYSENFKGILFMYDHNHHIEDIGDKKPEPNGKKNYYPGILKVHENVFHNYTGFVLRIRTIGQTYFDYLIMPQPGQKKNLPGDSYIFYIEEVTYAADDISKDFADADDYISNAFVELLTKVTEVPDDLPPVEELPFIITYSAVDEDDNAIGADGIFAGTGGSDAPTEVAQGDSISFSVTPPEDYEIVKVIASGGDNDETPLTAISGVYTFKPTSGVVITAVFKYAPPPPPPTPPEPFVITYAIVDTENTVISVGSGKFTKIDGSTPAPASVEQGDSISFKVEKPDSHHLVAVIAGETTLSAEDGVYTFTPGGDVTITAIFEEDEAVIPPLETPIINNPPEETKSNKGTKFVIISTASDGGAEVDPKNKWMFSSKPIKTYWEDTIKKTTSSLFTAMTNIKNSKGKRATWIWDREDSWAYGISGCFTVITASRFNIEESENVQEATVPFYLACDNAAVVYVNGKLAGYTKKAFDDAPSATRTPPGQTSDWRFTNLSEAAFTGDNNQWATMVSFDIKPFLIKGYNEILVVAANNDSSGGKYDCTNNPAGLLFACQFNVK